MLVNVNDILCACMWTSTLSSAGNSAIENWCIIIIIINVHFRLKDLPLGEVGGNGSNEALNVKTELIGRAQSQPKHDGNEREEGVQSCVLSYQNLQRQKTLNTKQTHTHTHTEEAVQSCVLSYQNLQRQKTLKIKETHTQRKLYNPVFSPTETCRRRQTTLKQTQTRDTDIRRDRERQETIEETETRSTRQRH